MYHSGYPPYGAAPTQTGLPPGPPMSGGHYGQTMIHHGASQTNGFIAPQMQQHHHHQQPQMQPQQQHLNYGQAMPSSSSDPNAFAHMFKSHLASLTFNSKPIITTLTVIAHENVAQMARVVAQCLDEHIMTAPSAYRLPALYALDSICKNVGSPYTDLWSDRIAIIFMETYRAVDHAIKGRMEELLNTWRHGGPNQSPLFGPMAQQTIERSIWGTSGLPPTVSRPSFNSVQQQHGASNSPMHSTTSSATTMPNVDSMLSRFDRLIAMSAYDQQHAPHLFDAVRSEALKKLRGIVASATLSPMEMGQIAQQLDSLEAETLNRSAAPSHIRSPQHSQTGYRSTPPFQQQTSSGAHPSGARSPLQGGGGGAGSASAIPPSLAGALANLGKLTGSATPPSHRSTPPPPFFSVGQQNAKPNAALDLVASLRQAGLLPASAPQALVQQQDAEYCQMIKGMEIKLTTADLQREIPLGSLEAITLKELPLQCRQCANRYPGGSKGQASLDRHLDWHFRQNRRAKDSAVRGQSRSWFSRLEQWIRGGHDDTLPIKHGSSEGGDPASAAALTPAQEAELKAATKQFVVAPSDDPDAATRPCPICKELFKSEWSEDEEDFVWKNCVKVDSIYYHGSCHYSAKTLSSARNAHSSSATASAGTVTPEQHDQASVATTTVKQENVYEDAAAASKVTIGVKRKSSPHDGQEGDVEGNRSPKSEEGTPAKRVAVA